MTKEEIKEKLDELGIEYDADALKADLEVLLPEEEEVQEEVEEEVVEEEVVEEEVIEDTDVSEEPEYYEGVKVLFKKEAHFDGRDYTDLHLANGTTVRV